MGSESTQIVAFKVVLDMYHAGMYLPHGVKNFIREMEKLGAELDYAVGFMPTCSVHILLAVELPGGSCLNCGHTLTFAELESARANPSSEQAQCVMERLLGQIGACVENGIEKALEARATAFLPTGVQFRGFEIVLRADCSATSGAAASAIQSLAYAVRDLIDSDPWELTDEAVVTGESLGTVPYLTCSKGATADPKNPDILYALAGVNYRGFPVSLKFTPNVGVEHVDVARAAITLRGVIESSKDDWSIGG